MSSEDFDFDESTPEGMKSLRKAYEKMQKDLAEERAGNATLAAKQRSRDVADKLAELGAKPRLAKYVPASVEVENLSAWLAEDGELFGYKPNEPTTTDSPANAEEAAAQERMSGFSAQLPGDVSDNPDLAAIAGAKTGKELADIIYARQAGIR